MLNDTGPVTITSEGQTIENMRVNGKLSVQAPGVTVRNVEILHNGEHGLFANNAHSLTVSELSVVNTATGRKLPSEQNNIHVQGSRDFVASKVRVRGGSSGIYMVNSPGAILDMIEGYNQRGPFPRGQLVQFNKCPNSLLKDFSAINVNEESWTEDNVSVFESPNCVIRRGLVDGNNSPSGVGVMFERSDDCWVEDVDAIRMGNGCFSAYPSNRVTFLRTRARDNICADQRGEGPPKSKALVWAGEPSSTGLRLEGGVYFNLCNPNNRIWDAKAFDLVDMVEGDFTPRAPIVNVFSWEGEPVPVPEPDPVPTPEYVTRAEFDELAAALRLSIGNVRDDNTDALAEFDARWKRIFNADLL